MIGMLFLIVFILLGSFLGWFIFTSLFDLLTGYSKPKKEPDVHIHYHQSIYNQSVTIDKTIITNNKSTNWKRISD